MLEKLAAALAVPELRKRIQFVFAMFAVYVLALHVPASFVNHDAMNRMLGSGTLFGALDVFSGGALRKFSIIAMGIMPYISASIVMQLLTVAIPQLRTLSKEGESGRKQISKITRYATIGLGLVQAFGYYSMFSRGAPGAPPAIEPSLFHMITIMITLTAGTMFLLWLGEQITVKGIGNGVSLIIFVGIMTSLPTQVSQMIQELNAGAVSPFGVIGVILLFLATIVGIVYMTQAVRKIPVQHVKRIVGNRMSQGGSSFLPFKVNTAGVIPIIFALQFQLLPATFAQFFPPTTRFGELAHRATQWLQPGASVTASLIFCALILFFTYFYTAIQYDTSDIADNLKKYGSFIPGVRPGKPTAEYLDKVLTRITLAAALFLAAVSLIQYWAPKWTGVQSFGLIGGTSLLIVVGVALETMQAIEAQMAMRNYEGFIKPGGAGVATAAPNRGSGLLAGSR
jgi:preprotein translocase subunit SecY